MNRKSALHSFTYYILQAIQMILSMVTNFFIVRKMSVVDYGYASLALSLVSTAAIIVYQWSGSSILYIRKDDEPSNLNKVIWSRNILLVIMIIPTCLIAIIFSSKINKYTSGTHTFLLLILMLVMMFADYYTNYLLAIKKQVVSSFMGIAVRLVLLILALFFLRDIRSFLIINILSNLVFIFFLKYSNKSDFIPINLDKETFNRTLSFSLWQAIGIVSLSGAQSVASIVINSVTTIEQVSFYNVAFKLISAIVAFETYVPLYFAPLVVEYISKNNIKQLNEYFYSIRIKLIGVALFFHVITFYASSWFVPALFGVEYYKSVNVFKVMLLYSFLYFLIMFYSQYANSVYRYKLIQLTNVVSAIVTIIFAFLLTSKYGAIGYAFSNMIGLVVKYSVLFIFLEPSIKKTCKKLT